MRNSAHSRKVLIKSTILKYTVRDNGTYVACRIRKYELEWAKIQLFKVRGVVLHPAPGFFEFLGSWFASWDCKLRNLV